MAGLEIAFDTKGKEWFCQGQIRELTQPDCNADNQGAAWAKTSGAERLPRCDGTRRGAERMEEKHTLLRG
jgi:hypothetical protein